MHRFSSFRLSNLNNDEPRCTRDVLPLDLNIICFNDHNDNMK